MLGIYNPVMSDFLTFIFIDLITTGLFYITGSFLVPAFTLGRVVAGGWSKEDNDPSENQHQDTKNGKVLDAWYVMVIGGVFWAIIAVVIWKL
jgi:hypothetical protein